MILTGTQILENLNKNIFIDPFEPTQLNPNSYNVRLANKLLVYDNDILDMKQKNPYHLIEIPEEGLTIQPGKLYLGRTVERTATNGFVPMLEGRSSVGRLGISIHETAGFGDIGFCGYWTLEISCIQPVRIYPNVEIGQVYYHKIDADWYDTYTSGKYQNNHDIQPSMMWMDFEEDK
jgi:dCTP deaminase